jgi:hypothetical protein
MASVLPPQPAALGLEDFFHRALLISLEFLVVQDFYKGVQVLSLLLRTQITTQTEALEVVVSQTTLEAVV